jgi:hypothetical protein
VRVGGHPHHSVCFQKSHMVSERELSVNTSAPPYKSRRTSGPFSTNSSQTGGNSERGTAEANRAFADKKNDLGGQVRANPRVSVDRPDPESTRKSGGYSFNPLYHQDPAPPGPLFRPDEEHKADQVWITRS